MNKSKSLQQLEICQIRAVFLTASESKRLYTESEGFVGESENFAWFNAFGSNYWNYVSNYWFNHGKLIEADLLVIAELEWLVVEVKNYKGIFEYKQNECYINSKLMGDNLVSKMNYRVSRMRDIAAEVNSNIVVTGAVVFINEHNEVRFESDVDFKVILRNQLKRFIQQFKHITHMPRDYNYFDRASAVLEKYREESPFVPKSRPLESFDSLRKGVTCRECHSFEVESRHKILECKKCGAKEMKTEAVLRSAHQLRYLFYDHPEMVTTRKVYEFCGGMFSKRTISSSLISKYRKIGITDGLYYDIQL